MISLNSPYTLIVIDMQPKYLASLKNCNNVILASKKEILKARKLHCNIIFVDYADNIKTIPELTSLCKKYPYVHHVIKYDDNGSPDIANYIQDYNLFKDAPIKIIGVYYDHCVWKTALGLTNMYPNKISIIKSACDTVDYMDRLETELLKYKKINPKLYSSLSIT